MSPTSTPAVSPIASAWPSPSAPATAWTETFHSDLAVLSDIVAGPQGLIATGCEADANGNCVNGLLLASTDGASWTRVDLAGGAHTQIAGVSRVGDRSLAIGERIDDAALRVDSVVWVSRDGLSWSVVPSATSKDRVVGVVVDTAAGAIAIGTNAPYASEGYGIVLWDVAPDGSFGAPRDLRIKGGPDHLTGAVWDGDKVLAWGVNGVLGEVESPRLVTSPDGGAWSVLPKVSAFTNSSISAVVAVTGRLVAVGYRGQPFSPRAWTSADARTWKTADVLADAGLLFTVELEGSRLVALGRESPDTDGQPIAWISDNGDVWTRLPAGEGVPDVAGFNALHRAVVDGRACVAGTFYGDPRRPAPRAAIYCK